jgi:hypothetical protein
VAALKYSHYDALFTMIPCSQEETGIQAVKQPTQGHQAHRGWS